MHSPSETESPPSFETAAFRPGRAWRTVAILCLLAVASFLDRMVISMLIEPIKRDLDLTDTQFSLAQGTAFAAAFALGTIPLGMAIDRYSRRHVVFLCVLCWAVGCLGAGFATGMASLILARMLLGLGEAVLAPAAASFIGDNFPDGKAATPLGVFGASNYAGFGISMALGGALIAALTARGGISIPIIGAVEPWRATFFIVGTPALLLAALAFALHDPQQASQARGMKKRPAVGWTELFRTRRSAIIALLLGTSSLTGAFSTVAAWTPAHLFRAFNLPPEQVGLSLGIGMGLLAALGSVIGGLMISRLVRSGVPIAAFVVGVIVATGCGPLFVLAHIVDSPTVAVILLNIGLFIFGAAAAVNFSAIQAIAPPSARGKLASLVGLACATLSYALAPLLVALLTDYVLQDSSRIGLSLAVVQAALCTIGGAAFWFGIPHLRRCGATASRAETGSRPDDQVTVDGAAPAGLST